MAWIESNQEVVRHPKTRKLARLLGCSVVTAVGHLHCLWWWAVDFAQDGFIGKYDECDIAEACMWEGDPAEYAAALLKSGYVDKAESGLVIHDWIDYAGRLIVQRDIKKDQTKERVKRYREKSNKSSNANVTQPCNASVTQCNAPTVPNLTVPNQDNIINIITARTSEIISDAIKTDAADCEVLTAQAGMVAAEVGTNNAESRTNTPETFVAESESFAAKAVIYTADFGTFAAMDITGSDNYPVERIAVGTQAVNWAEQNWGRMIPKGDADSIIAWCDEFASRGSQEPDAVVIEGLKCCLDADVRNMKYLRAVLTEWRESGISTVDHVKAREASRKIQKNLKRNKDPGDKSTSKSTAPPGKYEKFYL